MKEHSWTIASLFSSMRLLFCSLAVADPLPSAKEETILSLDRTIALALGDEVSMEKETVNADVDANVDEDTDAGVDANADAGTGVPADGTDADTGASADALGAVNVWGAQRKTRWMIVCRSSMYGRCPMASTACTARTEQELVPAEQARCCSIPLDAPNMATVLVTAFAAAVATSCILERRSSPRC